MHPALWRTKASLTVRSSSEWKEMTATRPPGRSTRCASARPRASDASSSLTTMRRAWKTRRAGLPAPKRAGVGMARLMRPTSSPVDSSGRRSRSLTMARAIGFA